MADNVGFSNQIKKKGKEIDVYKRNNELLGNYFFQACTRRDIHEIDQQHTSNYERHFYT